MSMYFMYFIYTMFLDFWIMRVLGVTIAVCAGSAFLLALTHCVMQSRKITRKITIMQVCFAIATGTSFLFISVV